MASLDFPVAREPKLENRIHGTVDFIVVKICMLDRCGNKSLGQFVAMTPQLLGFSRVGAVLRRLA